MSRWRIWGMAQLLQLCNWLTSLSFFIYKLHNHTGVPIRSVHLSNAGKRLEGGSNKHHLQHAQSGGDISTENHNSQMPRPYRWTNRHGSVQASIPTNASCSGSIKATQDMRQSCREPCGQQRRVCRRWIWFKRFRSVLAAASPSENFCSHLYFVFCYESTTPYKPSSSLWPFAVLQPMLILQRAAHDNIEMIPRSLVAFGAPAALGMWPGHGLLHCILTSGELCWVLDSLPNLRHVRIWQMPV